MKKEQLQKSLCLLAVLLSSCALMIDPLENNFPPTERTVSPVVDTLYTDLRYVKEPIRKPVIAVYADAFKDETGQRRSNSTYATFSSAVTQAPHAYLIRALKQAGSEHNGFFEVVERVSLDAVTKERQLIRSTRETFDEDKKLIPLKFADMIMTGGVLSYQANTSSGGAGARYLGIGLSKQYRSDTLTVGLRTVSVSTGKVLMEVLVTKTILSASLDNDVFRFITEGTELVELEGGSVKNEPISIALQMAIETAVLETIREGVENGYWRMKE
jgi:curli production assembly/transport component CsgG